MDINKYIQDLQNQDYMIRIQAVEYLGEIDSNTAKLSLMNSLKDVNSEVRYAAVKSLGHFKHESILDDIVKSLKDPAWYVRVQAGIILEKNLKDKNHSILEFLFQNDPHKLSKLSAALGLIILDKDHEKQYLKFIFSLLNDEDENIRVYAATFLGEVGDSAVVDIIINEYEKQTDKVKEAMIYTLSHYPNKKIEKWLFNLVKHSNLHIRSAAIQILENFESESTLTYLIEALNDENSFIRSRAAIALGNLGMEAAIKPLIEKLKDSNIDVAYYSKEALGKIGI